ncbi:hypothetical protein ABW19_dt0209383 [Dactylella cylindrospora]|nr:hypothetical protein ABW19_dt0209383 [Dactylella cylindrospora]
MLADDNSNHWKALLGLPVVQAIDDMITNYPNILQGAQIAAISFDFEIHPSRDGSHETRANLFVELNFSGAPEPRADVSASYFEEVIYANKQEVIGVIADTGYMLHPLQPDIGKITGYRPELTRSFQRIHILHYFEEENSDHYVVLVSASRQHLVYCVGPDEEAARLNLFLQFIIHVAWKSMGGDKPLRELSFVYTVDSTKEFFDRKKWEREEEEKKKKENEKKIENEKNEEEEGEEESSGFRFYANITSATGRDHIQQFLMQTLEGRALNSLLTENSDYLYNSKVQEITADRLFDGNEYLNGYWIYIVLENQD